MRSRLGTAKLRVRALAFALACSFLPSMAAGTSDGDSAKGRELSRKHCTLCHVVGDFNKFGGIGSTPSFKVLASMRDGLARFRSFFVRAPHPSFVRLPDTKAPTDYPLTVPEVQLSEQDVVDISAFAMTLKDPSWAK